MRPYPIYPLIQAVLWLLNEGPTRLRVPFRSHEAALSELGIMRFQLAFEKVPSVAVELASHIRAGKNLTQTIVEIRTLLDSEIRRLLSLYGIPATPDLSQNYLLARQAFDQRYSRAKESLDCHRETCRSSVCACRNYRLKSFTFLTYSVEELEELRQLVRRLDQPQPRAA